MSRSPRILRSRARLTAWLGMLALLAQLLAGGISQWHQVQRLNASASLLELCSSTSSLRSGRSDQGPGPADSASQHCPFCLAASGLPIPPAHQLAAVFLGAPRTPLPALPEGLAPRAPDLRHAPARAPPFFA